MAIETDSKKSLRSEMKLTLIQQDGQDLTSDSLTFYYWYTLREDYHPANLDPTQSNIWGELHLLLFILFV
jgi:hypothetical protein